ncbi:class I SAM-dependent methyltransferase [Pseudanabaenaceae cyanobacterium LEGE 13415]|nr:class I SAM-dependent methyltransferase [Pseudanabaenaceae cyanobacterium LEGE 13415]
MSQYVFTDVQQIRELERLQTIEQIFDPATRSRLQATGIEANWCCLEVGAGAGSIVQWLAATVGEQGKVVALDLDTQFVDRLQLPNVEVIQADIRHAPLQKHSFDLIHARYVLIHIADFQVALARMLDLLKPGGWIVIEEPDFSAARAIVGEACQSVDRVNQSILKMFTNRGMDYALGIHLPALFQNLGLQPLTVENEVPLSNGGSGVATVMKMSAIQLAQKYIETGEATAEDIEQYCLFADDPNTWAIYYATVGVIAQKSIAL